MLETVIAKFGLFTGWLVAFSAIFMRYIILAGLVFLLVYQWKKRNWWAWKIQQKMPGKEKILEEIGHSALTCIIFASMALGVFWLRSHGYGALYFSVSEHGWGYYFFSLAFMIAAHDTYFYWMHRLMHLPKLFRIFHLVHHKSNNPTPFTAFSFHPLEAVVEFGIIPIIALVMPVHFTAFILFTLWSIAFNVLGHTGYEFAPSWFTTHPVFKWLNTPTHHNMHHTKSQHNYSLYFNFWDRVMGTNDPEYDAYFESIKSRTKAQLAENHRTQKRIKKAGLTAVFLGVLSLGFGQVTVDDLKKGNYGNPESRTQQADELMKSGLGLSDAQAVKVHQINLRYAWRAENEVVKADLSDWAKYRKLSAIQEEKDAELKLVLDKDQFKKYTEKRDELFWKGVKSYFFG